MAERYPVEDEQGLGCPEPSSTSNRSKAKRKATVADDEENSDSESEPNGDPHEIHAVATQNRRERTRQPFKKCAQAPKRCKSAFIFFSSEKRKEIRRRMEQQKLTPPKMSDLSKEVADSWKNLSEEERDVWNQKAIRDKARFEVEKELYDGPWTEPRTKRARKDPDAPKRPPSAFLAFSNSLRSQVKRENPSFGTAEISKQLSAMWKNAPKEVKQKYIREEAKLREQYNVAISEWRTNKDQELKMERESREQAALLVVDSNETVEAHENSAGVPQPPHVNPRPVLHQSQPSQAQAQVQAQREPQIQQQELAQAALAAAGDTHADSLPALLSRAQILRADHIAQQFLHLSSTPSLPGLPRFVPQHAHNCLSNHQSSFLSALSSIAASAAPPQRPMLPPSFPLNVRSSNAVAARHSAQPYAFRGPADFTYANNPPSATASFLNSLWLGQIQALMQSPRQYNSNPGVAHAAAAFNADSQDSPRKTNK